MAVNHPQLSLRLPPIYETCARPRRVVKLKQLTNSTRHHKSIQIPTNQIEQVFPTCHGSMLSLIAQVLFEMVLASVDALSDNEGCGDSKPTTQKASKPRGPLRQPRRGFKRRFATSTQSASVEPLDARRLVSSSICGCLCRCFKPFNESIELFEKLMHIRKTMASMKKLEKDQHVTS